MVHKLWGVEIPDFACTWGEMMTEKTIFPGHNLVSPFIRPSTLLQTPNALLVSAHSLELDFQASIIVSMHPDNIDRDTWLHIYHTEKKGLLYYNAYEVISQDEYWRLHQENNATTSITTM